MKNLFNSFYSIVLLALCLIAFSNCSDSDDVRGQENVKRALEVAAAGGHNRCRRQKRLCHFFQV